MRYALLFVLTLALAPVAGDAFRPWPTPAPEAAVQPKPVTLAESHGLGWWEPTPWTTLEWHGAGYQPCPGDTVTIDDPRNKSWDHPFGREPFSKLVPAVRAAPVVSTTWIGSVK